MVLSIENSERLCCSFSAPNGPLRISIEKIIWAKIRKEQVNFFNPIYPLDFDSNIPIPNEVEMRPQRMGTLKQIAEGCKFITYFLEQILFRKFCAN